MRFFHLIRSSRVLLAAGLGLLAVSCSTKRVGAGATITKVNPYHLTDAFEPIPAADPSLAFERAALLHGAISVAERRELQGDYFTIFWKAEDRTQPLKVRLEYRQKATGLKVKTIEQDVTDVRRTNTTKFAFIGNEYVTNGPVTSWRASIVRGKDTLVDYKSYLWE
jgi:hypothetical protein